MKVVNHLSQMGLLHTVRGRNGGLRLAQHPQNTRLGEIVRLIEADMALVECFGDGSACPLAGACHLAAALDEAKGSFISSLNQHTLLDLVPANRARKILSLGTLHRR